MTVYPHSTNSATFSADQAEIFSPEQHPVSAPDAPTIAKRDGDGVWHLTCRCPLCGERHFHGGGSDDAPDLSLRGPHCRKDEYRTSDYNLVLAPEGHELYAAAKRDERRYKAQGRGNR